MIHFIDEFPGRMLKIKGREYLYFGGTSYLGLQTNESFQKQFIKNIKKYGTNYGASRIANVRISIFEKAEQYLANLVGSEGCTTLSSGYLAGQFVAQFLKSNQHPFFYAPDTHCALHQDKQKKYPTFETLNTAVRAYLASAKNNVAPVVFIDAIDFTGCNYPDFESLKILPLDKVLLVVDDSHGIGIVGKNGGGVYKMVSKLNCLELLVCCSLGKGFGIQAGAVFGTKERISQLTDTSFFGGASPAAPAALATLLDTKTIHANNLKKLKNTIEYFTKNLECPKKFHFMEGHPAFTFTDVRMAERLAANEIIVTEFPYPDSESQLMSRIILSAAHKKSDIERLLKSVHKSS